MWKIPRGATRGCSNKQGNGRPGRGCSQRVAPLPSKDALDKESDSVTSKLFAEAQRYIPGGVNSPVRAFKGVGGEPLFIERAQGAYLFDSDGRRYIDYVGSWGPMVAGHAHPHVLSAVQEIAKQGLSFGAPTKIETQLARSICACMPAIELVRMVNSGTEATMSAIRLARGFTGRDTIVKFEGCYHGHSDSQIGRAHV